jgi:hypothetical protein
VVALLLELPSARVSPLAAVSREGTKAAHVWSSFHHSPFRRFNRSFDAFWAISRSALFPPQRLRALYSLSLSLLCGPGWEE